MNMRKPNLINRLIDRLKNWLFPIPILDSEERIRIIDRYEDFKEVGEWSDYYELDENGIYVKVPDYSGGKIYVETVKYIDKNGKICIGEDWILKNAAEDKD